MNVMDDTLADESGIPFLSSADDIPVHSTPIKGTKIPLPSTKNVLKQLLNRPGRYEEYTDGESVQSIRHSDIHLQAKGQFSTQKGQGQNETPTEDRNFVRKSNDYRHEGRNSIRNIPDLSDIDNLRQKARNSDDIRVVQPERSRSPAQSKFSAAMEFEDIFKRPMDVPTRYRYSVEERKRNSSKSPVNNDKTLEENDRPSTKTKFGSGSERFSTDDINSNAYSSSKNMAKYRSMDERTRSEFTDNQTDSTDFGYRYSKEFSKDRTDVDNKDIGQSSREENKRGEVVDSYRGEKRGEVVGCYRGEKGGEVVNRYSGEKRGEVVNRYSGEKRGEVINKYSGEKREVINRYSRDKRGEVFDRYNGEKRGEVVDKYSGEKSAGVVDRLSTERKEPSCERKRFSVSSPRQSRHNTTPHSRTLSSSKQNTSLSELENTTLQKQRQEIQLLMGELKDRDRELSDMMTSHQQQLVAWQQDRDRLVTLERKCAQHEEELRSKASQLRNALSNIKTMKTTEGENKKDIEKFRSDIENLSQENTHYKEEIAQLQSLNETLQVNVNTLSNKVGKLEAREEELTTSLRLKEKDISSATGHMRELSERLQQLDLKCKEFQDRERDALREKHDWKQKYENTKDEFNALADEMNERRKESVRLSEENKSARQQLALIQKEAGMMERCKDELIDSMRVKQERTDTQLRNLRELYDRQVREVASLQLQLDNSKELIYRQQSSLDDQQLNSSYHGRLSQASEFSLERSSASQRQASRNKSSPSQSSKYREPDMTGSNQHSQSSGYQSQLYENQTGNRYQSQLYENQSGNHQLPSTLENNYINLTGSKQFNRQYHGNVSDRTSQAAKVDNQNQPRHHEANRIKETDKLTKYNKQDENFANVRVDPEIPIPNNRDASREVVSDNYQLSIPKNNNSSAKVATHTPPKVATKLLFDSPQRHDGYIIQETTIEFVSEDLDKNSNTGPLATCCEMSETALEAMRKAEKMLSQHSEAHKHEIYDTHKEQLKHITHREQSKFVTHREHGKLDSDTLEEKGKLYNDAHKDDRKYDTHKDKEQTKHFSVTHKRNENHLSETHQEEKKTISDMYREQLKSVTDIHTEQSKPVGDIHKEQMKGVSDIHKEQGKAFCDRHEDAEIIGEKTCDSVRQGQFYSYTHKESGKSENSESGREVNKGCDKNNGAKIDVDDKRKEVRVNLNDQFAEVDYEEQCEKEFEKKYTFENKLCSFLEDLDDIDDSIWDEKPIKSTNVSTMTESSPASKLRKLLIESQEMIHSLEKSSESPRQVLSRDTTGQREKGSTLATAEKVQHKS